MFYVGIENSINKPIEFNCTYYPDIKSSVFTIKSSLQQQIFEFLEISKLHAGSKLRLRSFPSETGKLV